MNFAGLLFLLAAHYLCGKGMLRLFKMELKPAINFFMAMLIGVAIISFVPCFVQLLHMPIDVMHVSVGIVITALICSVPLFLPLSMPKWSKPSLPKFYEWPFIVVCGLLMLESVWRCFYYPSYARDMLAGPELLAEYAVKEQTMISSVYTIDLQTTNNYFKSPFITGLQIDYKLLVCSFGQVWLSVIFIGFMVWLYPLLRNRVHALVAGFLLFFFLIMPELYAYTFVLLYDYSNMVFFFIGFYYLSRYMEERTIHQLMFAAFMLGLATYIRTETLILVAMITPMLLLNLYKNKTETKKIILLTGAFAAMPILFYLVCNNVFVKNFVPIPLNVEGQLTKNPADVSVIFSRLWDLQNGLIFTPRGINIYGYFIYTFYTVLALDLVFFRKFSREAKVMLYGVAVVFFGLAFIGYLLPLADIDNTTKRGVFKALPMMLIYMADSAIVQRLGAAITKWEFPAPKTAAKKVAPPVVVRKQGKKRS